MDSFEKYFTLAIRYLTIRPRSEKEIADYLKKKEAPSDILLRVISELKRKKFLNDEEFAKSWVRHRSTFKLQGDKFIKFELRRKGISSEIIEKVLGDESRSMNQESPLRQGFAGQAEIKTDDEKAAELVQKRIGKYKGMTRQEIYQKLGGFLARRGFDYDTIKAAIDKALKQE
jgi:regulatory protein